MTDTKKPHWHKELLAEVLASADPSFMGSEYWEFRGDIGGVRFTLIAKRKKNGVWRMKGWHAGW